MDRRHPRRPPRAGLDAYVHSTFRRSALPILLKLQVRWWCRLQHLRLLLRHTSGHSALVISLVLSVAPLVFGAAALDWDSGARIASLAGISLIALLAVAGVTLATAFAGITLMAAAWSFERLPPTDYAKLAMEGVQIDRQFRWLASEMRSLPEEFLACARRPIAADALSLGRLHIPRPWARGLPNGLLELSALLESVQFEVPTPGGGTRPNKAALSSAREKLAPYQGGIEARLRELARLLRRHHGRIQQVILMKTLLAGELGVENKRLCDHAFRFSPLIYERRARKWIENWETILSHGRGADHMPGYRLEDILHENSRIIQRMQRRAHYLELLIASRQMLEMIAGALGRTSTRESVIAYATTLAKTAQTALNDGARAKLNPNNDEWATNQMVCVRCAQLHAAVMMQRVNPGTSLHTILINLCRNAEHWCCVTAKHVQEPEERAAYRNKATIWNGRAGYLERLATGRRQNDGHHNVREDLERLAGLHLDVMAATYESQWRINDNAIEALSAIVTTPNTAIVVAGYSKTVRDLVKANLLSGMIEVPRVFVAGVPAREFDARLMEFELGEDHHWFGTDVTRIGLGDPALFAKLVEPQIRVVVLVGARSYDRQGRVVGDAAFEASLRQLRADLGPRATFVVVAEGHKECPDLSELWELYRDGLEGIAVYEAGFFDLLISDAETKK